MAIPAAPSKGFWDTVRTHLFHGSFKQSQMDGIIAIWNACIAFGITDIRWIAYILATVYHETSQTMQPIREYGLGHGKAYGLAVGPFHQVYYGRGYYQVTWYANYLKFEKILGIPLAKNPDLALQADVAAKIIVYGMIHGTFTTRSLDKFINATECDFVNSREIINGHDCANAIAVYANVFLTGAKAV